MNLKYKTLAVVVLMAVANTSGASCKKENYYVGGGIGLNSSTATNSTGYQFMGGYCLDFKFDSKKTKAAFEVGYMLTGDQANTGGKKKKKGDQAGITSSDQGLWLSGLTEYKLEKKLNLMGRVGMDLGLNNGVIFGAGVGYDVSKTSQVRAEYVIRSAINSMQLNLVSRF